MKFELPVLPYAENGLEPEISEKTIKFHYGKHHAAYVENANKLLVGSGLENESCENIIKHSNGALFNNAAQAWNHTFYFMQFTANKGQSPKGKLLAQIENIWGTFEHFKEKFVAEGVAQFGSGWVWLIIKDGKLEIVKTSNAGDPLLIEGAKPIMCFDVWEHAYYLDYQNRRADSLNALWNIIDWDVIEKRFETYP